MNRLAGLVLAIGLLLGSVVPVAAAGGQRTVVVFPTVVGQTFTVSGCGYTTTEVSFYVYQEATGAVLVGAATGVGLDGCFSYATGIAFAEPGIYEAQAFQLKRSSHGSAGPGSYNENHPAAYLDFEVVP